MREGNPQLIGKRYRIQGELGAGGMGTVYHGLDTQTQQSVAIKVLKSEAIASDPGIVERFAREAEALRQLNHPNIVKVLNTFQEGDQHTIVMEYVAGGDLRDKLQNEGRLPVQQVLEIALDLSDALTRAHRLKIIHRDLKPANVLIAEDGTPRLTDFGVARIEAEERVTETGATIGTFNYLSPEALNGEAVDSRSDIWAFGVMLYEMLTGERPFQGESISQTLVSIISQPTPDLEAQCAEAPIELVDLVYRMLEKDPKARIPSVRMVGAELEAILHNLDISDWRTPKIPPTGRFDTPSSITLEHHPNNLPAQTTPFVGRESELLEVSRLLDDPNRRLVTILAPGGMGKTRLGLEVAERQLPQFPQGVFFVSLAPISAVENIVPTIAEAVNFQFQQDNREPQEQLIDFFREKKLLLLMDNFEHILDGAGIVTAILQAAPNVQVLATSRERLNLSGETLFNLEGMDFPDWETPADALEYSAVKLFMQSAQRAQPGFTLEADDLTYVARICRMVYGMPLGILLAAAWVEMLTLEEIADEIGQSLDFLETEMRDVPERHRSIRAVFEYSWNLIGEAERETFARLAVFQGGFTRQAAQVAAGASLRSLTALVNKSLLRRDPDSGRYEVHALLQQYGLEYLEAAGLAAETRDAHSAYYADFLHGQEADIRGKREKKTVAAIEVEIENIRQGWWWAVERDKLAEIDKSLHALAAFYEARGWAKEAVDTFGQLGQRLRDRGRSQEDVLLHRVCLQQARLATYLGHFDESRALSLAALAVFRANHLEQETISALNNLSYAAMIQGDYGQARAYGQEAVELARGLADLPLMAVSLANVGYVAYLEGNYAEAQTIFEQVLADLQAMGDGANRSLLMVCLNNLGEVHHAQDQEEVAGDYFERSLALAREVNNKRWTAITLNNLGNVAHAMANFSAAQQYNTQSLELYREVGDRRGMAEACNRVGGVAHTLGNFEEALQHYQFSLQIAREIGDKRETANALVLLGISLNALGRYDEAEAYFKESIVIRRAIGNMAEVADAIQYLGLIAMMRDDLEAANRHNEASLVVLTEAGIDDYPIMSRYRGFKALFAILGGDFETGRDIIEKLLPAVETTGLRWRTVMFCASLGQAYHGLGRLKEAHQTFHRGIQLAWETKSFEWGILNLLEYAMLLATEGQQEQAVELLAFCTASPFAHHFMKVRAQRYLERLKTQTPAQLMRQKFVEASERGGRLTFADVIPQLFPDINAESVKEPLE